MQIDPRRKGNLPEVGAPEPFTCPATSARGWRLRIPGGRPLATPAVADGRVFFGGGFGSYEFYCLEAQTGRLLWQYQTSDDGPTAAVVEDGHVIFNTESCELEVLTLDGKSVWKRWLGDPLMSMPAARNGQVFMVYPDSRGDHEHYLACFELQTGQPVWRTPITGEVITAPILSDQAVFLTTLEGTLHCCSQRTGEVLWREAVCATSSPTVHNDQCYFSQRRAVPSDSGATGVQQTEHCAKRANTTHGPTHAFSQTSRQADYLDHAKRQFSSPRYAAYQAQDAGVGFAAFKGSAKIHQAMLNLGHGHVSSVWAYQGSKPFVDDGRLFSALGDALCCVEMESGDVLWTRELHNGKVGGPLLDSVITPPALVNGKAFVCTFAGNVFALDTKSGDIVWQASVGEPIEFQPAVARGRVYIPTATGTLFCIETGDAVDDGWLMWGATPAHNGLDDHGVPCP